MRFATIALFVAAAYGQAFDPKLPASVPEVSGKITEQATLRYIDVQAGSGALAAAGQLYTVHYTGWLRDGTQFDSSSGKDPLQFVQGRREVIPGFDVGFEGMKVGGKRRIFIPQQLAYGDQQRGKIPPKSELIFDVELLAVKDAPAISAAAHLLFPLTELQDHVISLAKALREDQYDWRPALGVRSIREVLLHIAYSTDTYLTIANTAPSADALQKVVDANTKKETAASSKDEIVKLLTESFQSVHTTLDAVRTTSALNRTVDFFGTATTRQAVLTGLDTHIAEHLGQLIAYARINGMTPPWSAAK